MELAQEQSVAVPAVAGDANAAGSEFILLIEEIDMDYVPTERDLLEAADLLGVDLEVDADLMWVVEEFFKAPVPEPWRVYEGDTPDDVFYFNAVTGASTWDHPNDEIYRQLYHAEKKKKAPLMILTVSRVHLDSEGSVSVSCTAMSGNCAGTFHCESDQDFADLSKMAAGKLEVDSEQIRFILPDSTQLHESVTLASVASPEM